MVTASINNKAQIKSGTAKINKLNESHFIEKASSRLFRRYIYWVKKDMLNVIKPALKTQGYSFKSAKMTPCETLNASGKTIIYAIPQVWNRMCARQGSWYRESDRAGQTLLVSGHRLPDFMKPYLDAEMTESNFNPGHTVDNDSLRGLIESPEYQTTRPDEWENAGIIDSIMFKIFFTVTRFWGFGDNFSRHWLSHRANHANFLTKTFTTRLEGEDVPYSVVENKSICSSCVEFFNVTSTDTRKLVNACPGSISFSSVERDTYYDVKPVGIPVVVA